MSKKKSKNSETEEQYIRNAADYGVKTFIDLKNDYAFKWTFGTEGHEDLLLMLLDSLMPEKQIRTVKLGPQEQEPDRKDAQGGIYDINCQSNDGSSFTVEMQVCPQNDFNDRMVFYSSFPIRNRVGVGAMQETDQELKEGLITEEEARKKKLSQSVTRYKLPHIYVIGILNFELSGVLPSKRIIRHFSIREDEDSMTQLTDSVHYVTVELPKFKKSISELVNRQDYMLYALKELCEMNEMPEEFVGKGFDKLFEVCRFASMKEDAQMKYVRQVMAEWDRQGQMASAIINSEAKGRAEGRAEGLAEGRAEGRAEGHAEIARSMKAKGMDPVLISEITGLTLDQITAL